MPEGDAVWRTARRLDEALGGRTLVRSDFRVPDFATVDLSGETVHDVVSRGKHLFAHVGDLSIHTHLKMEGRWDVYARGARWRRPAHEARLVLETASVQAVGFALGVVAVLTRDEEDQVVARLGPDLLDPELDAAEALRRLRSDPDRPLADALLDQGNLAGIGNVYRNEVMFVRGLHPDLTVADDPDLGRTVRTVRRMLLVNRDFPEIVTTGVRRRGERTWVYGRGGEPCRRCGARVERRAPVVTQTGGVEERVTYWCPRCQPAPDRPAPERR
ncbi:DNA-formamidopyrimidine glycosylase family protein [Mumia sp.]|uniref:DNA-formamidopyrimidine glycosylase family protein n=1 Tax=Mumia sp. TaxID=1965300 RepID=UPI0026055591|nr:DNA-formamidopyrimidine glycosylase family protein [Mumia sp.]MDD9347165.1 Fpg/Nei family DNA glycosylase [Mumia sp.]